jgi:hypothetical protein
MELPRNLGTDRSPPRFRIDLEMNHSPAENTILQLRSFTERTRCILQCPLPFHMAKLLKLGIDVCGIVPQRERLVTASSRSPATRGPLNRIS